MKKYDICIIGAGIIGTTLAYTLKDKYSVCVIEKLDEPGMVQTYVNSSVIHSGVYYSTDQNILQFCINGKELLKEFCEQNYIKYQEIGKEIVCSPEVATFLINRCKKYGLEYRKGNKSVFIQDVGLMDYKKLANTLYMKSLNNVDFYFNVHNSKINKNTVIFNNTIIEYNYLINVAGTSAIDIYKEFSNDYSYTLCEIAGYYHEYDMPWKEPIIYKYPDEKLPFLGPHITPTLQNTVKLGPNAVPRLWSKTHKNTIRDILIRRKFIQNNKKFFKWNKKLKAENFLRKECQRIYGVWINPDDWIKSQVGVRSILLNSQGEPINQFIIKKIGNTIHFLNSHSPAATSTFEIARYISELIRKM